MAKLSQASNFTLRAVKPNAGLRDDYRRRLIALVKALHDDVLKELTECYEANTPRIAMDAERKTPAQKLREAMSRVRKRWDKKSTEDAEANAAWFAKRILSNSKRQRSAAFSAAGLPKAFTIGFDRGRVTKDVFDAITADNVSLIKSISSRYLDEVEGLVMRSVTTGRDVKSLASELQQRYNVTRRRADLIARDQNNKATESLVRAQDAESGITHGVWIHIPGKYTSRETHRSMDGKKFALDKGLYDSSEGKYVLPGECVGCQCTYRPILPRDIWKKK